MLQSYSNIYQLGHRETLQIFGGTVTIEEKVDGSQFSFGKDEHGTLMMRSKNKEQWPVPDKMFNTAVDAVLAVADRLPLGWTYRGEYLSKPKHNVLAYDRVPKNNIVIFDIDRGNQDYMDRDQKEKCVAILGFECVPLLCQGIIEDRVEMLKLLETTSFLGGQSIEGFVIKQYDKYDRSGKVLMAKYVSEKFKEVAGPDWKKRNPGGKDLLKELVLRYTTQARWSKAVQHLREEGKLKDEPCDIGPLIKEIQRDIFEECGLDIAAQLLQWARPQIERGIIRGFPEWYKEKLANNCFEEDADDM